MKQKLKMSWTNPKVYSKNSPKSGLGVFTRKSIKKNEIIAVFGGYVVEQKKISLIPSELQDYYYQISDTLFYGPTEPSNVTTSEYFNHSCSPNSGFKDAITLVAIKNIRKNEEITFDYATCMTSNILNLKCKCGNNNCRKKIKGSDWKITTLQRKYKNYFQPYIKEKIKKIKQK